MLQGRRFSLAKGDRSLENDGELSTVVYEPHHLVYRFCEDHYGQAMLAWLHDKPKKGRTKFFRRRSGNEPLLMEADDLRAYLDFIEDQFKFLLAHHSPVYWLHL
jgi:hypothetical protein